jgi:multiple sugar transport system permease protein
VRAVQIGKRTNGGLLLEVTRPYSLQGAQFDASVKNLHRVPQDAKVVTADFGGKPVKAFVAENMLDGRTRLRVMTPTPLKGTEFMALPSETKPLMVPGMKTENYGDALEFLPAEANMGLTYLRNTLILVVMSLLGTILSSALVAYGFSRLRFPGKNAMFAVLLSTMMLPGAVTMLPSFLIFRSLGWIDTLYPLWVPAFFASAFNVFLLRQFFSNIPMELEDAAKIDGCSHLRTFWQVMLPQIKPALAVIAIWTFMGAWNNFMGPLIYVSSPEHMPIAYAVQLFQNDRGGEPALTMAFATMAMMPVLLLFFFAQKYFIEGVQLSGLGGR